MTRTRSSKTALLSALVGLLSLTLGVGAGAAERLLDQVPLPAGARLHLVGHDIVQNGRLMSIATFASPDTVEDVLAWYAERWAADEKGPGHVLAEVGGWRMVSRLQRGSNIALQLKPSEEGGARGLLSVMPLDGATRDLGLPPMPPGARLLSDTRADDPGGEAVTQVLRAPGGSGQVAGFYRDRMKRDGWVLQHAGSSDRPAVLLFSSRRGRVEVVATPHVDGGTLVILNSVTADR